MKKLIEKINDFSIVSRTKNISSYASSMAFFIFMSFVPMLMIVCSVLPYTGLTEKDLFDFFAMVFPSSMSLMFEAMVDYVYQESVGALSIAILITIWSAGRGAMAL